jgi:hypothetical protein
MKNMVYALPLIEVDVEGLSKTYSEFLVASIACISSVHITNESNIPVIVSFDGAQDHDIVLPKSRIDVDFPDSNKGFLRMDGYYLKAESSGSGKVYIATYAFHMGV